MGNVPSSEMPRKLLKSKPPSLVLGPAEGLSPEDEGLFSPVRTRYCHGCLAASCQTMSYQHLPSPSHDARHLYRQPSVASISPLTPSSPWPQPDPIARSQLRAAHSRTDAPFPDATGRLARAKSVAYPSDCSVQSLTRTYTFHSNAYVPYSPHALSDTSIADRRRYSAMDLVHSSAASPDTELPVPLPDDALGIFVQPTDSSGHLGRQQRAQSTSYVPMRRRSVILTPGVATRAARDHPPLPAAPVLRVRQSTPVIRTTAGEPALSPTSLNSSELQERSVTPCAANYRQLGSIKFGTLRITNGSPVSHPIARDDDPVARCAAPQITTASSGIEESSWPLGSMVDTDAASGVEAASEFHLGQPFPNGSSPTFPSQNTPGKGYSACQGQAVGSTLYSPRSHVPRTPNRQGSPRLHDETRSVGPEYISPEVLDVRIELTASSHPCDKPSPRLSNRGQNDSAGSDSGFISSSTSSRQSSQRTLHKADSGYSSNLSLRSMRSNSSRLHRDADKPKRVLESAPPIDQAPQQSPTEDDDPYLYMSHSPLSLSRNSFAQASRERLRRLSTRASKVSGLSPSASWDFQVAPAEQTLMRRKTMTDTDSATIRNSLGKQETPRKQGKLHRLLGSARRQSRVMAFVSPHDAVEPVPAIPVNLEEKLHGRDTHSPRKQAFLDEPQSQHNKVPRADGVENIAIEKPPSRGNYVQRGTRGDHTVPPRMLQQRSATLPISLHSHTYSTGRLSAEVTTRSTPAMHRPYVGPIMPSRDERWREARPAEATSGVPGIGIGEDGAFAHDIGASSAQPRRALTKPSLKTPTRLKPPISLKSRASAPSLMSSPTMLRHPPLPSPSSMPSHPPLPMSSSKPSHPPRPSSSSTPSHPEQSMALRTRSFKTARDLLPSQTSTARSASTISPSQKTGRESFQRRSQSAKTPGTGPAGEQPQMRHSYSVYGRHPPVVFRQPRQRQTGDGDGQNFRVLHSYNSPAYRNVPIWG